ncbi:MAG: porin family protein, partial [bacterium]|nr:porin family protein [bacterium]
TWHLHNGGNPTWNNPDIQLYDSSNNPVSSNNLVVGQQYTIKATIHNDTDFPANAVKVTFKGVNFGVGQPGPAWGVIDTDTLNVPANDTEEAEAQWVPPRTGHLCIQAEIYHNEDINEENNLGQENCDASATSSPAKVPFLVYNPTDKPAALHLELRQLLKSGRERIWPTTIVHPDPQMIPPGESKEAVVEIDPDKIDIRPCQTAEFALTGFINSKVVGGANFIITKKCDTKVPPLGLSIHGGFTLPITDFGSRYNSSFMWGLDIDYRITRRFSLMGFMGYNHFRAAATAGSHTHWWNISGNLKFDLSSNPTVWPYINGGIGLYIPKIGNNKLGFNIGLGLDRTLTSNLVFEIGLNYHHILTKLEDPEFLVGHLGLIFRF